MSSLLALSCSDAVGWPAVYCISPCSIIRAAWTAVRAVDDIVTNSKKAAMILPLWDNMITDRRSSSRWAPSKRVDAALRRAPAFAAACDAAFDHSLPLVRRWLPSSPPHIRVDAALRAAELEGVTDLSQRQFGEFAAELFREAVLAGAAKAALVRFPAGAAGFVRVGFATRAGVGVVGRLFANLPSTPPALRLLFTSAWAICVIRAPSVAAAVEGARAPDARKRCPRAGCSDAKPLTQQQHLVLVGTERNGIATSAAAAEAADLLNLRDCCAYGQTKMQWTMDKPVEILQWMPNSLYCKGDAEFDMALRRVKRSGGANTEHAVPLVTQLKWASSENYQQTERSNTTSSDKQMKEKLKQLG
ncbi:hypothetical protein ABZP36_003911 [Zizania latifolia]